MPASLSRPRTSASPDDSTNHTITTRRRPLPGPRALIGGLLVAIAGLGTYATASGAIAGNERTVVVATSDLAPGTALSNAQLRSITMTVDAETARNLASSPAQLHDAVLLGPVRAGEMIQAGNLVKKSGASSNPELSIALPRSRAVAGDLRSGETVDVIVSTKDEVNANTAVTDATVIEIDKANGASGGVGGNGDLVVTLSVRDRSAASAVATAVDRGEVTLVRTTGL